MPLLNNVMSNCFNVLRPAPTMYVPNLVTAMGFEEEAVKATFSSFFLLLSDVLSCPSLAKIGWGSIGLERINPVPSVKQPGAHLS